jgi:hypothetical protein
MEVSSQCHAPAALLLVLIVQEAVWALGSVWTGAENFAPTGIRSSDLSARSELLYRLSYPVPEITITCAVRR